MHEDRARLVDGRLDRGASGCLVVERRERESGFGCLDQHAGEDRLRVALRQELDDERHGFAEHIAIDVELHGRSLDIGLGLSHASARSAVAMSRDAVQTLVLRRQGDRTGFFIRYFSVMVLTPVETVDNVASINARQGNYNRVSCGTAADRRDPTVRRADGGVDPCHPQADGHSPTVFPQRR